MSWLNNTISTFTSGQTYTHESLKTISTFTEFTPEQSNTHEPKTRFPLFYDWNITTGMTKDQKTEPKSPNMLNHNAEHI